MLKVETEGATVETHTAGDRQVCRQKLRGKYEGGGGNHARAIKRADVHYRGWQIPFGDGLKSFGSVTASFILRQNDTA